MIWNSYQYNILWKFDILNHYFLKDLNKFIIYYQNLKYLYNVIISNQFYHNLTLTTILCMILMMNNVY